MPTKSSSSDFFLFPSPSISYPLPLNRIKRRVVCVHHAGCLQQCVVIEKNRACYPQKLLKSHPRPCPIKTHRAPSFSSFPSMTTSPSSLQVVTGESTCHAITRRFSWRHVVRQRATILSATEQNTSHVVISSRCPPRAASSSTR